MMRLAVVLIAILAAGCAAERPRRPLPPPPPAPPVVSGPLAEPAIAAQVTQYGPAARQRLQPHFAAAGVPYPPARFLIVGLKQERELQLYAADYGQPLRFIRTYPILGASGRLGPKLREGDRQVPEGIYEIDYINPRSKAHLSLAVSYPNDFDRARAIQDGRDEATLGGEIMIHGGNKSIGCLAVGDQAAEELFVMAAEGGFHDATVVISPLDFRRSALPAHYRPATPWVPYLYRQIQSMLITLPPAGWAPRNAVAAGAP